MESRDIEAAAARLQGKIHNIHVSSSQTFSKMSGCELYLKCENRQKTGSFKVRGAYNKLALLKERGVVAVHRSLRAVPAIMHRGSAMPAHSWACMRRS